MSTDDSDVATLAIFGPPGCGKTTSLARRVQSTIRAYGSDSVRVCSFTKAAAAEIGSRGLAMNPRNVGTLHSFARRSVEDGSAVMGDHIPEWNAAHPEWAMTPGKGKGGSVDSRATDGFGGGDLRGDQMIQVVDNYRATLIPVEQWQASAQTFNRAYTAFKADNHFIDYTDMLTNALKVEYWPGMPEVIVVDEAQDCTPLEMKLIRQWARKARRLVVCGDDDQAQPGTVRVLTEGRKWVRMDQLSPAQHRLVSYDLRGASINGIRKGHQFTIAAHKDGRRGLFVAAGKLETQCTPDHRWWVKFDGDFAKTQWVVYLMRQGDRFRIGWCQVANADGANHMTLRARLEKADAMWVLKLCTSKSEASIWESVLSVQYGIPTVIFDPSENSMMDEQYIGRIFDLLGDLTPKAIKVLEAHGRMIEHPMWTPGRNSVYGQQISQIRACNLLPGIHKIPAWTGESSYDVQWHSVLVSRSEIIDVAYSIDVEPYHTYIVDNGIITSNCLYRFRGADPAAMEIPGSEKEVLSQSYRVPRKVHAAAQHWVQQMSRRVAKDYRPRDEEGSVTLAPYSFNSHTMVTEVERWLAETDGALDDRGNPLTLMILASTGYLLDPVRTGMRQAGIPFHNPWAPERGDWNPLAPRTKGVSSSAKLAAYLKLADADWTGADVQMWASVLKKDTAGFRKPTQAMLDSLPNRELTFSEVAYLFRDDPEGQTAMARAVEPSLDWYAGNVLKSNKGMEFPIAVARRGGVAKLSESPRVVIGTIHSLKGSEATRVMVCPELSSQAMKNWIHPGEARDMVRRQFYVAMTRARSELVIARPHPSARTTISPQLLMAGVR